MEYRYKAYRVLDNSYDEYAYDVGDICPASHRWIDGEPTEEILSGTSGISPDGDITPYLGDIILTIAGDHAEDGEDPDEIVIENAIIIGRAKRNHR